MNTLHYFPFCMTRVRLLHASLLTLLLLFVAAPGLAQTQQLTVDLSTRTGPILHGASGWLYGQSEDGIPTENLMAPLHPQVGAQKPPDGLQHPSGDALLVAPAFRRAGGKEMQIYLQDIYWQWPYDKAPIDDYIAKVQIIAHKVSADPNRDLFSYVPFNEPEYNWYGYSGEPLQKFLADWKAVYQAIRAIDPKAKIVGPNYSIYRSETYRQFLVFARDNHVLPDELSWHELTDDFFPGWEDRYRDANRIEASLGIPPLPIVINEYARARGDLAQPGKLIPWIAHFENSKVQACLAFWGPAGTLNDLVARSWPNRPTGAWWAYKWYGGMTGETVSVFSPDAYGFGLQGLAAVDPSKKQARILFGGGEGPVNVVLRGLDKAPFLGGSVHVAAWSVASSGIEPSSGPAFVQAWDYSPSDGKIAVTIQDTVATSAYYLVVTPSAGFRRDQPSSRYEAAYADLSGSATIHYGKGKNEVDVSGFNDPGNAAAEFVVTAPEDGYYSLTLGYSADPAMNAMQLKAALSLDGAPPKTLDLSQGASGVSWSTYEQKFYLDGGIHRFSFQALADGSSNGLRINGIDLNPAHGKIDSYSASNSTNTLSGTVKLDSSSATGVTLATGIGAGEKNFLQFNRVRVPASGSYKLIVSYSNNEQGHSGPVERFAEISVNGDWARKVFFRNTFSSSVVRTHVMDVELNAGDNSIRFANPQSLAPEIVQIQIAAP